MALFRGGPAGGAPAATAARCRMGKKGKVVNQKAVAAKARKEQQAEAKAAVAAAERERQEAEEWKKGSNRRAAKKDQDRAAKDAEKARRKKERQEQEAQESASISSSSKARAKPSGGRGAKRGGRAGRGGRGRGLDDLAGALAGGGEKKSRWEKSRDAQRKRQEQSEAQRAEDDRQAAADEATKKLASMGIAEQTHHLAGNSNREDDGAGATGVDAALDVLGEAGDDGAATNFATFFAREAPRVREENPGLKTSQVKDHVMKLWRRSPENPRNQ